MSADIFLDVVERLMCDVISKFVDTKMRNEFMYWDRVLDVLPVNRSLSKIHLRNTKKGFNFLSGPCRADFQL
jgi:hypothetical protein